MWRGSLNYNFFIGAFKMQCAEDLRFNISNGCKGFMEKYTPTGPRDLSKVNEGDEVRIDMSKNLLN